MDAINISPTIATPMRMNEDGSIRVGGTRVPLETVISDYQQGSTPEEIVRHFDVLKLPDVYYVIGYYLQHQAEVDAYIQHVDEEGERIRAEWEAEHPPKVTKADLLARLEAKRQKNEEP